MMLIALQLAPHTESWSVATLISTYASHRTAFYSLWNYLWLVIATSLTASFSLDPVMVPRARIVRVFLLVGFLVYAAVNYSLIENVRGEMQNVVEVLQTKLTPDSLKPTLLSFTSYCAVAWTHIVLDIFVVVGHGILIGRKTNN